MYDPRWVEAIDNLSGLFWRLFPNNIDVVGLLYIFLASVQDFVRIVFWVVLAAVIIVSLYVNLKGGRDA